MTRSHCSTTREASFLALFSAILMGILFLATPALAAVTASGTTITLAASPSSVTAGSVVTLTATVTSNLDGTPLTSGQVVFCNTSATHCEDSAILGTVWVTSKGTATLRRTLPPGATNVVAVFQTTKFFTSSTSSVSTVTVTGQSPASGSAITFPSLGNSAAGVVSADFNNDGYPDLAVTDNNGTVQIFLGKGDGTFTAGASISLFAGGGSGVPVSIATGDFNGDGNADLVVQGHNILLGNGDGTFTVGTSTPNANGQFAQIGDFNQDGYADILLYAGDSDFTVLLGHGDGTFTLGSATGSFGGGQSFAIADFNGDGFPDIVVSGGYGVGVEVLLGNGDGTFARTPVYLNSGVNPQNVTVGDFNGDGSPDIAVSDLSNQTVTILTNPGSGTVASYVSGTQKFTVGSPFGVGLPSGSQASLRQIVAADLTGDGRTDLAIAIGWKASGDPSLVLLPGNGDGTFASPSTFTAAPAAAYMEGGIAIGDFFGTGRAALAMITGTSPSYLTILQDNSSGVTPVKTLPIITWSTPAAITNPTPLSATQLNATANFPGTFTYNPAIGTVLAAGTQTLMVTFTPTDTTTYSTAEGTVTLTVNPAPVQSYTFTASATTLTGSGTITLNLHSINYTGTVSFNAVVTSSNGTASNVTASAPSVALTNDASGSTVLTVTASSSAANHAPALPWQSGGAIVFGAVLLGVPFSVRRKHVMAVLIVAATIMLVGFSLACSTVSGSKAVASRIYTVTVTPTGTGTVTDAKPITVTVTVK